MNTPGTAGFRDHVIAAPLKRDGGVNLGNQRFVSAIT